MPAGPPRYCSTIVRKNARSSRSRPSCVDAFALQRFVGDRRGDAAVRCAPRRKSRTRRSSRFATRGVPRLRAAIVRAASASIGTPSTLAERRTMRSSSAGGVVIEMVHDAEALAQRRGQHAGTRRRADEREALQRQLKRLRIRAAVDDEVDLKILHRGIEKLFDDAARAGESRRRRKRRLLPATSECRRDLSASPASGRWSGESLRPARARSGPQASSCRDPAVRRRARARAVRRAASRRRSRCAGFRRRVPGRRTRRTSADAGSRRRARLRACPADRRCVDSSTASPACIASVRAGVCARSRSFMPAPSRLAAVYLREQAFGVGDRRDRRRASARIIASASPRLYPSCSSTASASSAKSGIALGRAAGASWISRELRDLALELRDDVARLLLPDAGQALQKTRNRRGRSRRRSSTSARENARAAERGPIDATVISASKNSRSIALVNP